MNDKTSLLLSVKHLNKSFTTKGDCTAVLKDINFEVFSGECVGIVGESGSGKSTLARVLCRIYQPDSGSIEFAGQDRALIKMKDYYRQVQMIFQDPLASFPPRMKVRQYVLEPFYNFKLLAGRDPERLAEELLLQVGLGTELLCRYPHQLSGGQLQRLAFARATGMCPSLLICDEATSALDATVQKQVIELFGQIKQEIGFACLFITHDLALAEMLCDTIHVMDDGQIVETLTSGNGLGSRPSGLPAFNSFLLCSV